MLNIIYIFYFQRNPTQPQFAKNLGQSIDAKIKQALIYSKQKAFENLNALNQKHEITSSKINDQVARPAEVQTDILNHNPPPNSNPRGEFYASPELSPLFTRDNQPRDHFSPMNHYYRPVSQDARFPTESPFSENPMLDTRWLGGNRSPMEATRAPIDFMIPPQQARNTNVNFPFYNTQSRQTHRNHFSNEEKVTFPSDDHNPELRTHIHPHQIQVPALNFKQPTSAKGSWKWIPDESVNIINSTANSEEQLSFPPTLYETSRPQTAHDRPYSFESSHSTHLHHNRHQLSSASLTENFHHRIPTGPAAWPSSGSESLLSTDEYRPSSEKHEEGEHLDIKLVR